MIRQTQQQENHLIVKLLSASFCAIMLILRLIKRNRLFKGRNVLISHRTLQLLHVAYTIHYDLQLFAVLPILYRRFLPVTNADFSRSRIGLTPC